MIEIKKTRQTVRLAGVMGRTSALGGCDGDAVFLECCHECAHSEISVSLLPHGTQRFGDRRQATTACVSGVVEHAAQHDFLLVRACAWRQLDAQHVFRIRAECFPSDDTAVNDSLDQYGRPGRCRNGPECNVHDILPLLDTKTKSYFNIILYKYQCSGMTQNQVAILVSKRGQTPRAQKAYGIFEL